MTVTLSFTLRQGHETPEARFRFPAGRPLTRVDDAGWFVTTGHSPDLFEAARGGLRHMLDHLERDRGLSRERAYCLAGAAVDLKISQIVNEPNWIVSAYLPEGIFLA